MSGQGFNSPRLHIPVYIDSYRLENRFIERFFHTKKAPIQLGAVSYAIVSKLYTASSMVLPILLNEEVGSTREALNKFVEVSRDTVYLKFLVLLVNVICIPLSCFYSKGHYNEYNEILFLL